MIGITIFLITIAVFFYVLGSPANLEAKHRAKHEFNISRGIIGVDAPHPENCQDKTMLDFIAETPKYKLEPIFKQYVSLGLLIKPLFVDAFTEKLTKGEIARTDYYQRAGIGEKPPQTATEIIYQVKKQLEEDRAGYIYEETFEITGIHIPARKSFLTNHCEELDWIELVAEPRNKFDKNAIKVRCNDKLIGYIASHDTYKVHKLIANPHYAYLSGKTINDGYVTAEITIEY